MCYAIQYIICNVSFCGLSYFLYYEDTPSLLTDACAWIGPPNVVAWNHWVAGPAGQGVQAVQVHATRVAYSDASDSRYSGYVVELRPDVARGQWSEAESKQNSTWKERKAIYLVLKSYA